MRDRGEQTVEVDDADEDGAGGGGDRRTKASNVDDRRCARL